MIIYWIQNSDYSNPTGLGESEPVKSAKQILDVLMNYDWAKENAYEDKCLANEENCCPAGIGLVAQDSHILHICPNAKLYSATVYFHHRVSAKVLGFIKTSKIQTTTYEKIPLTKLESPIKNFLAGEYETILKSFHGYTS